MAVVTGSSAFADDDNGNRSLRQGFELSLMVCRAGRKGLVMAAESALDIFLEVGVEDREGAGEPGEGLLRDEQHDRILECHHKPGPERGPQQHALAKMIAWPKHLLEMLARLGVVDDEPERAFHHGIEAVDDHARLEDPVALAIVDIARRRRVRLDLHYVGRHHAVDEPVDADPELRLEPRQEREIETAPQQPGERARQLDAVDVGYRLAHAKRGKRAL